RVDARLDAATRDQVFLLEPLAGEALEHLAKLGQRARVHRHAGGVLVSAEAGELARRELGHFPLWCVPYRLVRHYEWLSQNFVRGIKDELFLDIAIYGMKQKGDQNAHAMIEQK